MNIIAAKQAIGKRTLAINFINVYKYISIILVIRNDREKKYNNFVSKFPRNALLKNLLFRLFRVENFGKDQKLSIATLTNGKIFLVVAGNKKQVIRKFKWQPFKIIIEAFGENLYKNDSF